MAAMQSDAGRQQHEEDPSQSNSTVISLGRVRGIHLESQSSAPEAHVLMKDCNSCLLVSKSERGLPYLQNPQKSRPILLHAEAGGQSPDALKYSRSRSQRLAELFGTRLQAEGKDQIKAASNPAVYAKFRTRSARFDKQSSTKGVLTVSQAAAAGQAGIAEAASDSDADDGDEDDDDFSSVKPGRYFDALHGPELDELRDHEVLMLPRDELWPFLLRFPLNCFGVCLGLGSQAILWKKLHQSPELRFLHIPKEINLCLWSLALVALLVISATYAVKVVLYFEAVRREFFHPVRVNFFFAPWIAGMFLALGLPPAVAPSIHPAVFCCLMAPVLVLELKFYGQWLSGGKRRLSKVANPSTHLSVVGNFVGSLLAATLQWTEPAMFFWSVGLAHYLVLFVTLYQRLPTNDKLPKDLHPVFFLFVAAPSTASVAWRHITGHFDYVSRLVFFVALFLYTSLVVRINFFCGIRFSFAWWAYTFPMAGAAIASIEYSHAAPSWITRVLAICLSFVSSATVLTLFCTTLLHAFVWNTLFQNDNAIAIIGRGSKTRRPALIGSKPGVPHADSSDMLTLENEPLHKIVLHHDHQLMSNYHSSASKKNFLELSGTAISTSPEPRSSPQIDDAQV